ncbi:FimD/PapC N-terminal domain-containing protein [Escherichia coli]|nr:FimD/PapC N-terminal domain-containing protein [Escherichia coli]EFB4484598.1 fimbria/pilus outer membrane usher protein [Escherichia coli]EFB4514707.1 fimbria/pilus outer membrane usher protein [Escherichia coli]MCX0063141.1 fimbria/pilus outer membrane usher protein [Escherichia coli]
MKDRIPFAVNNITCVILLSLFCNAASAVEFNTDVLDAADKKNIDFTRFSEAGYVLPGQYLLDVIVNGQSISPASLQISFVEPQSSGDKAEKKLPQACLTSDMVRLMGLTAESLDKVVYWHDGQCADFHGLPGVDIRPDTGAGVLRINMPQAWLEYSDATWLPPSRWDDGIPGLMLDYNLNGTVSRNYQGGDSHYLGRDNDSAYLRISVPLGTGTASYSGSMSNDRYVNMAGYTDTFNDGLDSYSLNAGLNSGGGLTSQRQINAYYSHRSPLANLSANIASLQKGYTSFGVSASGGATITGKGAALHAGGMSGGTRLLVDTDGVGGVPVDGGQVVTNRWGTGVVTDISSYYRNTTSVDLKRLPDDVEATRSVVESALTEGAIGYRKFSVLKGKRLFAILRLADGSQPPFGASVTSEKGRELGMVADEGLAWLSGVTPGETLSVNWDGKIQCQVNVPETAISDQQLLLPCTPQK